MAAPPPEHHHPVVEVEPRRQRVGHARIVRAGVDQLHIPRRLPQPRHADVGGAERTFPVVDDGQRLGRHGAIPYPAPAMEYVRARDVFRRSDTTGIRPMITRPPRASVLAEALATPVPALSLAAFRIALGAMLLWDCWRFVKHDRIWRYWVAPDFHFTYPGFG